MENQVEITILESLNLNAEIALIEVQMLLSIFFKSDLVNKNKTRF